LPDVAAIHVARLMLACVVFCGCASTIGCGRPGGPRRDTTSPAASAGELYLRGMSAHRSGDRDTAIRLLTEATRRYPNLAMAHSALGDIYKQSGEYEKASTQYETLAKLDPFTADNHHRLALSYHFLAKLKEAAAAYLRAIRLNPSDWKSSMNVGLVYMALGEHNFAVEYCQRAVNLEPSAAVAHANLGVALDASGNRREAEKAYRRSLELDPKQTAPAVNLAKNLTEQKRPAEAGEVLGKLVSSSPTPANRRRYGDALAAAGRDADAARQYRQALAAEPQSYAVMNSLANLLINQYRKGLMLDDRKRDEALGLWRQSLAVNPEQPNVQAQLKTWQDRRG